MALGQGSILARQHGFGLLDSLVGLTIVAVCTLGLSYSISSTGKVRQTYENFLALQSIKSAIRSSLRDPSNYSDAVRSQLANQIGNPGFINIQVQFLPNEATDADGGNIGAYPIPSNGVFFMRTNQAACVGFADPACFVEVRISLQVLAGRGPVYSLRYSLNPNFNESLPAGDSQVFIQLPNEIYKISNQNNSCSGTNPRKVAIRGMNRDTGEVTCIETPPNTACPDGQFTKGFSLSPAGELVLNCGAPSQLISCPSNYSLRQFSASDLDSGIKNGQCLFTAQNTANRATTFSGQSVVGQVCPPNYRLNDTCSPVNVTHNQPGRCTKICTSSLGVSSDCSYDVAASPGALVDNSDYLNGRVNCFVSQPVQAARPADCIDWSPPYWAGTTDISVNCQLAVPEIVSAQ